MMKTSKNNASEPLSTKHRFSLTSSISAFFRPASAVEIQKEISAASQAHLENQFHHKDNRQVLDASSSLDQKIEAALQADGQSIASPRS